MMEEKTPFDQYQRYKTIARIIEELKDSLSLNSLRILEIGANEHKNLEQFLPADSIVYTDVALPDALINDPQYFIADATNLEGVRDGAYDVVVACDVYEHIPADKRGQFISELTRVSECGVIFCFPFNAAHIREAERRVNLYHHALYGHEYIWLSEHADNGLPSVSDTEEYIKKTDYKYHGFEHGDIYLWEQQFKGIFSAIMNREVVPYRGTMDAFYNRFVYPGDRSDKNYRVFYVISNNESLLRAAKRVDEGFDAEIADNDRALLGRGLSDLASLEIAQSWRILNKWHVRCTQNEDKYFGRLYVDTGNGFSEESALKSTALSDNMAAFCGKYELPGGVKSLRFDPVENAGCIVGHINAIADDGPLSFYNVNGFEAAGMDVFLTSDPQYLAETKGRNIRKVTITASIVPLEDAQLFNDIVAFMEHIRKQHDEFARACQEHEAKCESMRQEHEVLSNSMRQQYEDMRREHEQQQQALEQRTQAQLDESDALFAAEQARAAAVEQERDALKLHNQYMCESLSWRITKPLRWVRSRAR